ncbi:TIR domain-containing protein [uncultured Winogradskyella sp.]|uniref:TIR domain-containing protein n=1 Tax=uncultured Winogradskyella sp. TaxID=395353 RepID=UPI0030D933C0|tara:strand:- start:184 stop:780 length:597 start_codon:yes stop_codon:yes gene_type:complete
MARNVYFSFHYQDVIDFRANVVRNSGKFRKSGDVFRDSSIWEEAKEKQVLKIKSLINDELKGSSVTCVLIGSETYSRRWVRYEIFKSFQMKKGQVGVGINWIKDKYGKTKFWKGENPYSYLSLKVSEDGNFLDLFEYKEDNWIKYKDLPRIKNAHFKKGDYGKEFTLSEIYNRYSYDWNNGKENFQNWIEEAITNVIK